MFIFKMINLIASIKNCFVLTIYNQTIKCFVKNNKL